MKLSREDFLAIVQTYPEGHHLRRFAETPDYPPGHMYLSYLGNALNLVRQCTSDDEFRKLLHERLRTGRTTFVKTQLYATLSEITIVCWLTEFGGKVRYQPALSKTSRNPDVYWEWVDQEYDIEIKCPDLFPSTLKAYDLLASDKEIVLEQLFRLPGGPIEGIDLLPQDNKVKDFLEHANEQVTKRSDRGLNRRSLLCITWSHRENEALVYLLGLSGLLTDRSFHRDALDQPVTYPNIDGVLVTNVLGLHNDWFGKAGMYGNPFRLQNARRYISHNPSSPTPIQDNLKTALSLLIIDEAWVDKNISQLNSMVAKPSHDRAGGVQ